MRSPKRRCHQAAKEEGRSLTSPFGQPASLPSGSTNDYPGSSIVWLDTARRGSRSNGPPRLIDQTTLSLLSNEDPHESTLRSVSSEHTDINSNWLSLEGPSRTAPEERTSNATAVEREIKTGTTHHRGLFQNDMPCSVSALLETTHRVENVTEVTRTSGRTKEHIKLIRFEVSLQLTDGPSNLFLANQRPAGSPRSLLCAQLEALASTEKGCPDQSEKHFDDVALSIETGRCYGAGSVSRTDDTSARCADTAETVSELLFPAPLSNVASVVTRSVLSNVASDSVTAWLSKESVQATPCVEVVHHRVRRRRASGYADNLCSVALQTAEVGQGLHEAFKRDRAMDEPWRLAQCTENSKHGTTADLAHEERQNAGSRSNEIYVTPVLAPRVDTLASEEKLLTALHLPSAMSPNDFPSWHGRVNANMGADVRMVVDQGKASDSQDQPTINISSSKPENECREAKAMWRCDDLKGQLNQRTLTAMRNMVGSPLQQQLLNSPLSKVQNEGRTAVKEGMKEGLWRCDDLKGNLRKRALRVKRTVLGSHREP